MASNDLKPQRFSVPPAFYWGVRGVHAGAGLFVGLGNLESKLLGRKLRGAAVDRPIYICGLPRAGTTISLQMLSEHPDVGTHKYADFLMPYAPYAWNWIFPKVPVNTMKEPVARIHRDRISVTRDSVEMVEEIIWDRFFDLYDESKPSTLDATTSNPAFEKFYRENIAKLLLVHHRSRYASKAIMCVLRMQYIRKFFPDARFLLYVRNPIDQIASILKQDRIFDEVATNDPRQIEILEMTAHHEFGSHQVLANVGNGEQIREIRAMLDAGDKVRARIRVWAYIYDFVQRQLAADPSLREAVEVVRYEDLCSTPSETIDRIIAHAELPEAPFRATRAAYAEKLSFPDYYKPSFSPAELADIVNVTGDVAAKFGYDVEALSARAGAPA